MMETNHRISFYIIKASNCNDEKKNEQLQG